MTTFGSDNTPNTFDTNDTRVLVIGFGVSGIVQTHTFVVHGVGRCRNNLVVVEAQESLGGVWNLDKHYPGLSTNNTKNTFELPELRHQHEDDDGDDDCRFDDYPTQEQVHAYLQRYVATFDLAQYVHYGTNVHKIERRQQQRQDHNQEPKWLFDVSFSKPVNGSTQGTFDIVVCATGFTSKPCIPMEYHNPPPGVTVLHSSDIRRALKQNPQLVQGKRVAVLGTSKSGQDVATWAAGTTSNVVDLIGTRMHWSAPRSSGQDLAQREAIYSGWVSYLLPCQPRVFARGRGRSCAWWLLTWLILYFFHETWIGRPVRDFIWGIKMKRVVQRADFPPCLIPNHSFAQDGRYISSQCPGFLDLIKKGRINIILERPCGFDFESGNLLLHDQDGNKHGEHRYDVVICATGWQSSLDFLSDEIKSKLYNSHGQLQLFRNLYCPSIPQIGFLGFHQSLNSMISFSVGARWIVEMAKGQNGSLHRRGVLDEFDFMHKVIATGLEFDAQGVSNPKGYFTTGMASHHYVNTLLRDMGSDYYNRAPFFKPVVPSLYK